MNKKHGFTLSELLMSIAIIAVVSAMGITIAKRNTDDAYKTYFAVGTMNLNNALAQIESGNVNVRVDDNGNYVERTEPVYINPDNHALGTVQRKVAGNPDVDIFPLNLNEPYPNHDNPDDPNQNNPFNNDFLGPMWITNNLKYLFGDTTPKNNNNACVPDGDCVINASNGITYEILRIDRASNNIRMRMTVPAPRRRVNGNITDRATTRFLYVRDLDQANLGNQHMLVPLNDENSNADPPLISIQNRQDLLTAYIDDGIVGRHILQNNILQNNFMPIRYGTYRDALCSILNQNNINMNANFNINANMIVDCHDANGVQNPATHLSLDNSGNQIVNRDAAGNIIGTAPSSGVIKFASPRKLK